MKPTTDSLEGGEKFKKFHNSKCKGILLQIVGTSSHQPFSEQPTEIQSLIQEFQEVFAEPTGLPPRRSQDHKIILQEGAKPTCVRPYRYPYYQKEEIEKLVKEMLSSGVIRPSQSPYSSHMLLVRKADGNWRMCVD